MFGKRGLIKAVNDISFQVKRSEFVSIVGESGSGKTTVAKCLLGLQKPDSGRISYNNLDITRLQGKQLRKYLKDVQMVYQDPFESLNPRHDVFTQVSTPLRYLTNEKDPSILRKKVATLLEEVELEPSEVMYRYPHQLSGGQRQRVNIARALAPDPKVLIADEPITMLDAAQRLNVLSLLMELKAKRGLTVVMITHELAAAKATSNRIMVMYYGKLVEEGMANAVLSHPHHPYIEMILAATPGMSPEKQSAQEEIIAPIEDAGRAIGGCIFENRCKYATDICRKADPPLEEKSTDHYAACHNPLNFGSS